MLENQKTLQEIADEMAKSTGKILGGALETHGKFIIYKEGEEGLKKVEDKMAELGYPLRFKDVKNFEYYPIGLVNLPVLVAHEIFHWQDKDIFEMGNSAPKYSAVVKLFFKYFVSLKRMVEEVSKAWKKHNTEGELTCDLDENKKRVVIKLEFDPLHPLFCIFLQGYFFRIFQFLNLGKKMDIRETKCLFKGDPYHEFLISWQ